MLTAGLIPEPAQAAVSISSTPAASWRLNGRVYATLIVGNTVYVGGTFTTATSPTGQQVTRQRLAAFSMDTGALVTTWRADAGSTVRALATDGSALYVGGSFGRVAGQPRPYLAKVSLATGQLDPTFAPAPNNAVRALEAGGGALWVGGTFTSVNGVARNRIVRLDPSSGAVDPTFTASVGGVGVFGVRRSPVSGVVYLVGQFPTVNGVARAGVAAVNGTTGALVGPAFAQSVNPTFAVDVNDDGSMVFAGGGTGANRAYGWRTATGQLAWARSADGDMQAIDHFDGEVYFGFHDGYGGNPTIKVRAVDAVTGALDADWIPSFNQFWGVFAIHVTDAGLVLGGDFTTVSGVSARGWARFPVAPTT